MNWKGWQRAVATEVDEVNMPVFATETFNERNQGAPIAETVAQLADVVAAAGERGVAVTGTVSAAWGCPFEGEVAVDQVVGLAEAVVGTGVGELALADTIGVADPWSVEHLLEAVGSAVGGVPLRVHFHDTRNTGLANVHARPSRTGWRIVDAAAGGIGGCPFAPAATGNIATEDLVFMLHRAGFATGVDLAALLDVSAGWRRSSVTRSRRCSSRRAPGRLDRSCLLDERAEGVCPHAGDCRLFPVPDYHETLEWKLESTFICDVSSEHLVGLLRSRS